jgi:hypothetical protein
MVRTHSPIYDVYSLHDLGFSRLCASLLPTTQNCWSSEVRRTWGLTTTLLLLYPMTTRDSDFSQINIVHLNLKLKIFLLLGTYTRYPSLNFVTWMILTLAHILRFSPELDQHLTKCCLCAVLALCLPSEILHYSECRCTPCAFYV